ncbi:hypothetical protein [Phocoenobacter atlanticus]|uniref:hypothetical protein n=1 Tax=Phocoenobacter atlanticus TaxID=3416742 RepID=UPI0027479C49|nr:hypothetical protein [Pasteurella atlantica]MDP8100893.1 hypothetical protein [Pasteurella atlantica]
MNKNKIKTLISVVTVGLLSMSQVNAQGYHYSQETIDTVYDMKKVTYADLVGWTHTSVKDAHNKAILDVYFQIGKVVKGKVNGAIYLKEGKVQCYTKESSGELYVDDFNFLEYFKSFDRSFNQGYKGYEIKKLGKNYYQMKLQSKVTVVMKHLTKKPHLELCK